MTTAFDNQHPSTSDPSPTLLRAIAGLRVAAWEAEGVIKPGRLASGAWLDRFDEQSHHWWVEADGAMIAAARLTLFTDDRGVRRMRSFGPHLDALRYPLAYCSRLVVAPAHRGRHLAKQLDLARLHYAKTHGAVLAAMLPVTARLAAVDKLGYRNLGVSVISPAETRVLAVQTHVVVHDLEHIPPLADLLRASGG